MDILQPGTRVLVSYQASHRSGIVTGYNIAENRYIVKFDMPVKERWMEQQVTTAEVNARFVVDDT